ncbi:unnamed protein product [Ectocarpus sp. 12 AP-2014]
MAVLGTSRRELSDDVHCHLGLVSSWSRSNRFSYSVQGVCSLTTSTCGVLRSGRDWKNEVRGSWSETESCNAVVVVNDTVMMADNRDGSCGYRLSQKISKQ